tara:strand:+ start:2678 stop:3022 length:345 start_codon:yes stop_codon:yes gene_type:complete
MHTIWLWLILLTCLSYFFNAEPFSFWILISAIFAPYIAWFCGSALKATIYGPSNERVLGTLFGIIGFMLSWYWITNTGFWVSIFNLDIPGYGWVTIGFLIGFLFTTKADSDRAL